MVRNFNLIFRKMFSIPELKHFLYRGLVLEPSKKYTQKVDQTFHISQAALDLKSCDQEPVQLVVEYENSNFILATLSKKANIFQVPLDLIFKTGDQVSFRTIGNGKVHLSGYHVLEDLDSMIMNGEEESDFEELEMTDVKGKRKKSSPKIKRNKKLKLDDTNEDESEDEEEEEEDESDEDEDIIFQGKAGKKKGKGQITLTSNDRDDDDDDDDDDVDDDDEDDDDDDEGDDDDEIEEEEEDEDDDIEMEDDDEDDDDGLNDLDLDDSEDEKTKTPKSENKKNMQTPNGVLSGSKGKEKSNQKLNKSKKDIKQGTPGKVTPGSESKSGKAEKHMKNGEGDITPHKKNSENVKNSEKTPKSPKAEGTPQKKVLEGGVVCEEIKLGSGPVAKPGKLVTVYYVGSLASNKKQFDSVQNGPGFKFRVGRNEVIKGWDIGINGMKVGGKRKLTIPPHLAYGSKGSPPVIPPNSALVFTVELKGLS